MTRLRSRLFTAAFGLAVALFVYAGSQSFAYWPFLRLQNAVDDTLFFLHYRLTRGNIPGVDDIIIVDIDDRSLDTLGEFDTWKRREFVRMFTALNEEKPRAVFLDVLLLEGGSLVDNRFLANSVRHAGNVIAGYYFELADSSRTRRPPDTVRLPRAGFGDTMPFRLLEAEGVTYSYDELIKATERVGFTNYLPDRDGVVRHMPLFIDYNGIPLPAAPLQIWLYLEGLPHTDAVPDRRGIRFGDTVIPTDGQTFMRLNFIDSRRVFPSVSFVDVQQRQFIPGTFRDRVVMIGASAPRLGDLKRIPGYAALPGVEVHAAALATIMEHRFVTTLPAAVLVAVLAVLGIGCAIAFESLPPFRAGLPLALGIPLLLYSAGVFSFIAFRVLINVAVPAFLIILLYIVLTVHRLTEHLD